MNKEKHIIIVWEKADNLIKELEKMISQHFCVLAKFVYRWEEALASDNYAAFYGEKLENIQYKVEHCGAGAFKVFLVEDSNPIYEQRKTSSGERIVNVNLFDLKAEMRGVTDGGHKIHASDTTTEANINSVSLFGLTIDELALKYTNQSQNFLEVSRNVSGVGGWKNWQEFFDILNRCTRYVVLRNYETVLASDNSSHGDTDLLVDNRAGANVIVAGKKIYAGKQRVLYSILVNGRQEEIDLRYVGDGYFPEKWQNEIIATREKHASGLFYIPQSENYKYMLLYHALVHKPNLLSDYINKLAVLFPNKDTQDLQNELVEFMKQKEICFSQPLDTSVYVHPNYNKYMKLGVGRKTINYLKMVKYRGGIDNHGENKCVKAIYTMFSDKCSMVKQKLRGLKGRIRKTFGQGH